MNTNQPAPTVVNFMIDALVKAFELANIETLIVSMPEAIVKDVSTAILRKWNCNREDIVGKALMKFGTGSLSARFIDDAAGHDVQQSIEVTYAPPLGTVIKSVFRSQPWNEAGDRNIVLVGQHASLEQAQAALNNEKRLNLALRSGGYALWDYDYQTGETYTSPELLEIFDHKLDAKSLGFKAFNNLIHPEDSDKSLDSKIKTAPFGTEIFQTRYRVRGANEAYIWIESAAGIIRDPLTGKPAKVVGLCRNVNEQMATLERLKASELALKRTQAVSHLGSFKLRVETGVSRLTAE